MKGSFDLGVGNDSMGVFCGFDGRHEVQTGMITA